MSMGQLLFVRNGTLKLAENLESAQLSVTPDGFNNNMLWNLGHIYVVHENLIVRNSGNDPVFPDGFVENFKPGTKPADWGDNVPTFETVVAKLKEQTERMDVLFDGHIDDSIPKPLQLSSIELTTVRDLIGFATVHEAMHATTIRLYSKLLKA